jgi:hypothetical protein
MSELCRIWDADVGSRDIQIQGDSAGERTDG